MQRDRAIKEFQASCHEAMKIAIFVREIASKRRSFAFASSCSVGPDDPVSQASGIYPAGQKKERDDRNSTFVFGGLGLLH